MPTASRCCAGPPPCSTGAGAISGVVNVIDNRIPKKPVHGVEGAAEYRYDGAPGSRGGVFRLEGGNGSAVWHLSGSSRNFGNLDIPGLAIDERAVERQEELRGHEEEHEDEEEEGVENTNNFIANTNGDAGSLTGGLSYHFGEGDFAGLSVSRLETEYGIPPGSHAHGEEGHDEEHAHEAAHGDANVRIDLEQTRYDAQLHWRHALPGVEAIRAFLTYTDYAHKEFEGAEAGTRYSRETLESRLELTHEALVGLHGVVGVQWREDEFSAVGGEAYIPKTDSTEFGLFIVEDFHRDDLTWELGARVDYVERSPSGASSQDFTTLSLSGAALWDFSPDWRLGLYASRNARAPATEELYSNIGARDHDDLVAHAAVGIIERGSATLDEEISNNIDLNVAWASGRYRAEVSLFYNAFDDYIFLFNSGEEADGTAIYNYRQKSATFQGFELDAELHLADVSSGALSLGFTGDYVAAEFSGGADVPRLPPLRAGLELNWQGEISTAWVSVQRADKQDSPGQLETKTDGYVRWDAGVDRRWQVGEGGELLAFVKLKNIGDEEIRLSTSFLRNYAPEPRRSLEMGMRYGF